MDFGLKTEGRSQRNEVRGPIWFLLTRAQAKNCRRARLENSIGQTDGLRRGNRGPERQSPPLVGHREGIALGDDDVAKIEQANSSMEEPDSTASSIEQRDDRLGKCDGQWDTRQTYTCSHVE
jgi:hypothetical protein